MEMTKRLTALDSVRGIAVILMIATHIWISFFWGNSNVVGSTLSFIGGYLSFELFLMVSGFLIGYGYEHLNLKKTIKRSLGLLVIYLGLGLFYTLLQRKDILSLFSGPIYLEEYLLTLAILPPFAYGLIFLMRKIAFTKKILSHSIGGLLVVMVGLLFVIAGKYTATINTNYWLSLLVGSSSLHTFPLISYGVVYGIGIWLGWSKRLETPKNYGIESLSVILATLLISFIAIPLEKISISLNDLDAIRWPPTLFFISSGITVSALVIYIATLIEKEKQNPISTTLQWVGKQAILFFVFHLIFIYTVQNVAVAKVIGIIRPPQPIVTPTPISHEERVMRMLNSTYQKKNDWPFLGYKAAFVKFDSNVKTGPAHIEIHPQDTESAANGADISVYGLLKDGGIKKITPYIAQLGNNSVVLNISIENNFSGLAISFAEYVDLNTNGYITYVTKPGSASGDRVALIDKNTTEWTFRPFETIGRKWFVKNTSAMKSQTYLFSMPVTCEDMTLYLEDSQRKVDLTENGKSLKIESPECVNIDSSEMFPAGYIPALSMITMPTAIDFANESIGKKTATYSVNFTKEGTEALKFTDEKAYWVSDPVYVAWTLDWEGYSIPQTTLDGISRVRNAVPGLTITHMFNPRLWNTSVVGKSNAQTLINYVKDGYQKNADEIAMHMHLYRDMVTLAGVTPLEIPGWNGLKDGYDIPFSEYSYEDAKKIICWGLAEFPKKGLPKPVTIRSGGWFTSLEVLKAAQECGIKIDTSGRTAFTSKNFGGRGVTYNGPWSLSVTTQPYWISKTNLNAAVKKSASNGIYEMPNNGGDSWAFSSDALIKRLTSNFPGETVSGARLVTYISHPDYFSKEGPKIEQVLNYSRLYDASSDSGPIVYITLQGYYNLYAK